MPDSLICINARSALNNINSLKASFGSAFQKAVESGAAADISRAETLKLSLEAAITNLQETINKHEAERRFELELKRQYSDQVKLLKSAKLIESRKEKDSSGAEREFLFMTGIDGEKYPLPSYEIIAKSILERKELFEMKADQGFKKLLLVPFGMSLDALIKKFKAFLVANKRKIPQFDKTQLALDETTPIWTWDGYNGADTSGALIYHPTEFTNTNHGGQTKQEILDKQQTSINQNQASGWNILFLQSGEDGKGIRGIPRNGSGVPVGKEHPRPDIEAGKSPNDYLKDQLNNTTDQSSPYHGEQGMTPEEWIIAFMTHLEETESLMDDWQDNVGSIAYLTGAYFQDSGFVPVADWVRDRRQVGLGGDVPAYQDGNFGVRSSVRVM